MNAAYIMADTKMDIDPSGDSEWKSGAFRSAREAFREVLFCVVGNSYRLHKKVT